MGLRGKPVAVVQYNPHGDLADLGPDDDRRCDLSDGSLIAVSYEARRAGVKRSMRGKVRCSHTHALFLSHTHTRSLSLSHTHTHKHTHTH